MSRAHIAVVTLLCVLMVLTVGTALLKAIHNTFDHFPDRQRVSAAAAGDDEIPVHAGVMNHV